MGWVPDSPDADSSTPAPASKGRWVPDSGKPKLPVTEPSELGGRLAGMPAAFLGWIKDNPVQAALLLGGPATSLGGEALGLGEAAGTLAPLVRMGVQGGIGAGTAALTGESPMQGMKAGLEQGVMGELPAPVARAATGISTYETAGTQSMRESEADAASTKALENELGTTRSAAAAAAQPTDVSVTAGPVAETRGAFKTARQAAIRETGAKYEPIYNAPAKPPLTGSISDQPVAPEDLGRIGVGSRGARQWLRERGIEDEKISPSTNRLLSRTEGYAPVVGVPGAGGPNASSVSSSIELPGGETVAPPVTPRTSAPTLGNKAPRAFIDMAAGAQPAPPTPPTIGQLRGHLQELSAEVARPNLDPLERKALVQAQQPIIKTLNDVLSDEDRVTVQQINKEYSQVNRIFDPRKMSAINKAGTLPELGKALFQDDAASSMAVSRMGEPQKQLMREAWASHVLDEGKSPTEVDSILSKNPKTLNLLYPGSDMGKVKTWRDMIVARRQFAKGPANLPAQKQFEQQLRETFQKNGLTPEAENAAFEALAKSGAFQKGMPRGFARYLLITGPIMGLMGWGPYHHVPELLIPAAAYGLGIAGWRALANNPAALNLYRQAIMSPWSRNSADAFGRLIVGAVNDAFRNGGMPEKQLTEPMKDMSEGVDALNESRAEHLAPTPSASDRAKAVGKKLEKGGKPPGVHRDLGQGRLSLDEVNKMLQFASSTDASKLIAGIPLTEVLDAAEVASPEERQMLVPLIKQRLMAELPKQQNKTLVSNLSRRFQKLQASPAAAEA